MAKQRRKTKASTQKAARPAKPKLSRTRKPDGMTLEQWQVALRREFGRQQQFTMQNIGDHEVFSEFLVTNPESGKTYRVAIRAARLGANYCSCPDFAVNALGTCKHVEWTLWKLCKKAANRRALVEGYTPAFSEVYLQYGSQRRVVFAAGTDAPPGLRQLAAQYFDKGGVLREDAFARFDTFLQRAHEFDHELRCYDDTKGFVAEVRDAAHRRAVIKSRYRRAGRPRPIPVDAKLYPYQREGVLFAAEAGRALIADDMGLGKTVQAIAAARIMAQEFGVENVLIICPASLKYQWKSEIEKFSDCSALVIEGLHHQRRRLYLEAADFKIVNYDVVFRDLEAIEAMAPDLVILDEAQRIKNWQTRTAKSVKQIKSPYALVLTGTPLENRLEELYSIVQFIDLHRLGPLFQFLSKHQITDPETGKVVGYQHLKSIGDTLAPILVRRTKAEVLKQLPKRLDKNFIVPMTREQWIPHNENRDIVARIVNKWRRYGFLSEVDRQRLMIALQYMRMACDSTYLVDKETKFGPKIGELMTLLDEIFERPDNKVVIFSQWTRMNDLVAEELDKHGIGYVYLHGGVPSKKRKDLMRAFKEDPEVRVFLSTDAGGVGLNLQSASAVINMDLPWNPAILEQRIGRVHRLGQHRPVQVVNFISEGTIEHGMLKVLAFKKSLFAGVLDSGEDMVLLGDSKLKKFMEAVETVTASVPETSHEPPAPEPEPKAEAKPSLRQGREQSSLEPLLSAGVSFLNELAALASPQKEGSAPGLASLLETDQATGRNYLRIPAPDPKVVETLVAGAASLLDALRASQEARP